MVPSTVGAERGHNSVVTGETGGSKEETGGR